MSLLHIASGLLVGVAIASTLSAADPADAAKSGRVYEMRVYYASEGNLDNLHARFRDHTMKLFEKHGMTNIGYWTPIENKDRKLVYLLGYDSLEARETSWKAFTADPDWQKAYKASEAKGTLVSKAELYFLAATDYSPAVKPEKVGDRVFELRTYTTTEGNLDNLHARFRDHTLKLFEKHGMTNLAYFTLTKKLPNGKDQSGAANTLVYFLAHKSENAGKASFTTFRQDPDWIAAKGASEKNGSLTTKDGVKSVYMKATDYSPWQ